MVKIAYYAVLLTMFMSVTKQAVAYPNDTDTRRVLISIVEKFVGLIS